MSKSSDLLPVGVLLDILYYAVNRRIAEGLAQAGFAEIRPAHGKVFENLGDGCRVSELAERAQVTKQSMAEMVAYLEQHRYLERVADETDHRAQIVRLTPRGRKAARAAERVLTDIYTEWQAQLGDARFAILHRLLDEIAQNEAERTALLRDQ